MNPESLLLATKDVAFRHRNALLRHQFAQEYAAFRVPDSEDAILSTRNDSLTVARYEHCVDRLIAGLEHSRCLTLGDIPKHWEVRPVKQVTKILRGKFTHRPRNDPSLYDGPYPFIQTGSVAGAKKFITEYKQTLNDRGLAVSKMFPKGTLCMTIAANIGDVAILDFEACFPDSVVGFVPRSSLDRDFLFFVFRCMKQELLADAPVNTQGNLNVERIGMKGIPFPPLEEQQTITKGIEAETGAFDTAIARTEREITLMQEYRTRLTADVVTGKLDVREAADKLPDPEPASPEAEEPEDETELEEVEG